MYMRSNNNNEFDNKSIISKIVNLRIQKANMLGLKPGLPMCWTIAWPRMPGMSTI